MLESTRKFVSVTMPRVSWKFVWAASTLVSFAWLLAQDQIHPVVVYLLQLYLTF